MTDWSIIGVNLGKVKKFSREDETAYAIRRDELNRGIDELRARLGNANGHREEIERQITNNEAELKKLIDNFVRVNLPLAIMVREKAMQRNSFLDEDEVFSGTQYALFRCALKYDPGRGCKFSTFAVRSMYRKLSEIIEKTIRYYETQGISIYREDEKGNRVSEILEDKKLSGADQRLNVLELRVHFSECMGLLSDREKRVLSMKYGIYNGESMTLEAIGRVIHVTRERVRQIQNRAQEKIKKAAPYLVDYLV